MRPSLVIGDFARATHMSVKTPRHYHSVGVLDPAEVDPETGYRRYATNQIPTAQVIRRFRKLDMPLDEIRAVLNAPDLATRNALIAAHLSRLEDDLARTQSAVASLRNLLQHPSDTVPIERRRLEATPAAAICEVVDTSDALAWYQGALGELHATLTADRATPARDWAGGRHLLQRPVRPRTRGSDDLRPLRSSSPASGAGGGAGRTRRRTGHCRA
jgi:DNA-binding transcriptional MerR regulator